MRKIYIGADSAGFTLKEEFKAHLAGLGYETVDVGAYNAESSHYPLFANAVCEGVKKDGENAFGVLICGTGIGMSMCANKHRGIRAAVCSDTFSAKMTRRHNDANVLCLGARVVGPSLALDILDAFLENEFEKESPRHVLRVDMIRELEK